MSFKDELIALLPTTMASAEDVVESIVRDRLKKVATQGKRELVIFKTSLIEFAKGEDYKKYYNPSTTNWNTVLQNVKTRLELEQITVTTSPTHITFSW